MYETILGKIDAVAAFLGILRKEQRTRPGVNPWGYTNGAREERDTEKETTDTELEKEPRGPKSSFESTAATLVEKKTETGRV
jgi:hypothetical protein